MSMRCNPEPGAPGQVIDAAPSFVNMANPSDGPRVVTNGTGPATLYANPVVPVTSGEGPPATTPADAHRADRDLRKSIGVVPMPGARGVPSSYAPMLRVSATSYHHPGDNVAVSCAAEVDPSGISANSSEPCAGMTSGSMRVICPDLSEMPSMRTVPVAPSTRTVEPDGIAPWKRCSRPEPTTATSTPSASSGPSIVYDTHASASPVFVRRMRPAVERAPNHRPPVRTTRFVYSG